MHFGKIYSGRVGRQQRLEISKAEVPENLVPKMIM
jgi:hypothetical protein